MEPATPFPEIEAELKQAGATSSDLCYQCGKCDVVCPWNRVTDFSMRKLVRQASYGLAEIEAEELWRCTSCGTCPAQCPRGVDQIATAVAMRRAATEYGVFPASVRALRTIRGSLTTEGNPLNEKRAGRAEWAAGLNVPEYSEDLELLWFVGCYYSYDPRLRRAARATAEILSAAGVGFGILGEAESCCGESIRRAGSEEVFRALARDNIKTFIDRGVKKILVGSPHCYHTLRNEYPEFMVNFEVVHITQLLEQLLEQGRLPLANEVALRATYHDPCYLGRHNGVFEAPRRLLEAVPGLELVEMPDNRQNSLCCGGGGGRIWVDTPREERFSDLRLRQAAECRAQALVTACPYCVTNFEDSRLNLELEDKLQVFDITEIIRRALQGDKPEQVEN